MTKTIVFLANKYPNKFNKNVNVFTQQVVWSIKDLGYKCIVICPNPINYNKINKKLESKDFENTDQGDKIAIYRPHYIGLGQSGRFLKKFRTHVTTFNYIKAVDKIINKLNLENNFVLFGEFLCPSGVAAAILGEKYNVCSFFQCGEATTSSFEGYDANNLRKALSTLTGAVALSEQNKHYLTDKGFVPEEKIIILPSGYLQSQFRVMDKDECRKKLGLPLDKFIVGFCGSYDERKGVKRLEKAVDKVNGAYLACVGYGPQKYTPASPKCLMSKTIDHRDLTLFYNAVDVYAMPTYNEGCCTAIVEAIACGKPIISSDRSFNYDICKQTNSILLDPDDIDGFSNAISFLMNNPNKLHEMENGSLEIAKGLTLESKAKKLVAFMKL